jgi:hypothetical protein
VTDEERTALVHGYSKARLEVYLRLTGTGQTSKDRLTKDLRALHDLVRWTNPILAARMQPSTAGQLLMQRPNQNVAGGQT